MRLNPPPDFPSPPQALAALGALAVLLTALAADLTPILYHNDTYFRIFHSDQIITGVWLPLLQLQFRLVRWWGAGLDAFKALGIFWSLAFLAALYRYLARIAGEKEALWGVLFFLVVPARVVWSVMPYQEALAGTFLLVTLERLERGPAARPMAWMAFQLACLTRYECWLLLPFLPLKNTGDGLWSPLQRMKWAAAPLLWLAWNRGLSPVGTSTLGGFQGLGTAWERWASLDLGEGMGWVFIGAAGVGIVAALRQGKADWMRTWGPFLALDLLFIGLLGPFSLPLSRAGWFPALALAPAVAIGGRLIEDGIGRQPGRRHLALSLLLAALLFQPLLTAGREIYRYETETFPVPFHAGRALKTRLTPQTSALIFADPFESRVIAVQCYPLLDSVLVGREEKGKDFAKPLAWVLESKRFPAPAERMQQLRQRYDLNEVPFTPQYRLFQVKERALRLWPGDSSPTPQLKKE